MPTDRTRRINISPYAPVLIGEMFTSQRGLGFLLTSTINLGQIDTIMAIALLLTVFPIACNALMMMFDRHLTHQIR
jgi:NitT/TauT family transport system permease protein